jgi:hypothetical protein
MSQEIRRRLAARTAGVSRVDELAFPRFGLGLEQLGETADKLHVGRFSDGYERLPETAADKGHVGRFSEGVELRHDDSHVGRFADHAA